MEWTQSSFTFPKKQVHSELESIFIQKLGGEYSEEEIKTALSDALNRPSGQDLTIGEILERNRNNQKGWY